MEENMTRLVSDLIGRLTGPLTLRLFLQPAVAVFFAVRDGFRDARANRPPHLVRLLAGPPEARRRRARETWKAVLTVFIMAVLIDCAYQLIVFRWVYPFEALITAVILAFVPYLAVRGGANRLARLWIDPHEEASR